MPALCTPAQRYFGNRSKVIGQAVLLCAADGAEQRRKALGVIDKIVNEPVGGAHRDHKQMAAFLKRTLNEALRQVSDLRVKDVLDRRYDRLQSYGRYTDIKADAK